MDKENKVLISSQSILRLELIDECPLNYIRHWQGEVSGLWPKSEQKVFPPVRESREKTLLIYEPTYGVAGSEEDYFMYNFPNDKDIIIKTIWDWYDFILCPRTIKHDKLPYYITNDKGEVMLCSGNIFMELDNDDYKYMLKGGCDERSGNANLKLINKIKNHFYNSDDFNSVYIRPTSFANFNLEIVEKYKVRIIYNYDIVGKSKDIWYFDDLKDAENKFKELKKYLESHGCQFIEYNELKK